MRIKLRRPAGDVDGLKITSGGIGDNRINCFGIHVFLAAGPGIQVAMAAHLIAKKTQIDLQGMGVIADQFEIMLRKGRLERHDIDGRIFIFIDRY